MKSFEKLQQLQQDRHFTDKEIYRSINMEQGTYSSKKLGRTSFKPDELRSIEKELSLPAHYLDEDAMPLIIPNITKQDLSNIVIDLQVRLAKLEASEWERQKEMRKRKQG